MKIALIKTKSEKMTPLQNMNHPSIVKKTYKTKPRSQFQFSPLDGAQFANTSTAQITIKPKEDHRNNYNTRKVAPSYTQQMNSKTRSKEIRAKLPYFPNQAKEKHVREMIIPAHPAAAQRNFPFL